MRDAGAPEVIKSTPGGGKPTPVLIEPEGLGADRIMTIARAYLRLLEINRVRAGLSAWQERTAKRLMMEHLVSGIQVATVARECALSRSHFSRAFKNSTGLAPRDWFQLARLTRAKALLEQTQLSISQVSSECGFADQSHFTRMFSKKFGKTPGKWRL
jgi:AraC-like DNA-binding protein